MELSNLGRWYNRNIDIERVKIRNRKDNPNPKPLLPGVYQGENYTLELISNKQYNLYLSKIKLLSGKWSYDKGELLLHYGVDNTTFSLQITDTGLKSQLLPGEYKGIVLVKIR